LGVEPLRKGGRDLLDVPIAPTVILSRYVV
jgi:hypothetical protein